MNRKLKAMGLTLFAAFAIGAIGAQAASADLFQSEVEDTVLTEADHIVEGEGEHEFTYGIGTVNCKVTNFSGTMSKSAESEVTITPTYDECEFLDEEAVVRTNHCGYIFTAETNEGHAPVHVECENDGEHVEVEVPSLGHCLLTIEVEEGKTSQTTEKGVTYTDVGGEVTVDITAEVIAERHNPEGNFFCSLLSSTGVGVYTGKSLLQGYKYLAGPSTEWTEDTTAETEDRGTTHWTWGETHEVEGEVTHTHGEPVEISATTG